MPRRWGCPSRADDQGAVRLAEMMFQKLFAHSVFSKMCSRLKGMFNAIAESPCESMNVHIRATPMTEVQQVTEDRVWAQKDAAQRLGVAEGAIADLMERALAALSPDFCS